MILFPIWYMKVKTKIYVSLMVLPPTIYGTITMLGGFLYMDDEIIIFCNPPIGSETPEAKKLARHLKVTMAVFVGSSYAGLFGTWFFGVAFWQKLGFEESTMDYAQSAYSVDLLHGILLYSNVAVKRVSERIYPFLGLSQNSLFRYKEKPQYD
ncbi:unnamed protein product [Caenorhabditis auriculariae]|uniref:Uncharacterized protein n=1 Tax=Caenorhabditis auriculariae TaxID=2777116 RepID=A0A8S1HQK2_9PELO|nr:unnamed protein product [Caenorhabditis auriculariae]